ncbi:MAG: hypothetical protein HC919_09405 [Oscillatoriales cyanobacterium SM2_2_1]|nr:hypothetical protein [Oscillatoriales cyanobacterium SM2_2_1]
MFVPFFIFISSLFAYTLSTWKIAKINSAIATILFLIALSYSLITLRHPILSISSKFSPSILTLSRDDIYFSGSRKELRSPYLEVARVIHDSQCRNIGLAIGGDDWEYPLWVLLQKKGEIRIIHTKVANPSKNAKRDINEDQLCAVIATDEDYTGARNAQEEVQEDWVYQPISQKPFVAVYLKNNWVPSQK